MHLKDGGKTIELRIFEKEPMPGLGIRPGIFPDKIVVKQRNNYLDPKDAPHEEVVYTAQQNNEEFPSIDELRRMVETGEATVPDPEKMTHSELLESYRALEVHHGEHHIRELQLANIEWQSMETAPKKFGERILVYWPTVLLDDNGDLTDEQGEGDVFVTEWQGYWLEPNQIFEHGAHLGDGWEWSEEPTLWMPINKPLILKGTG